MRYETARVGDDHPVPRAMVEALRALKKLHPPCWRHQHHGPATHVLTIAGALHAVCRACATDLTNDRRVARQRDEVRAMRARRR
jgi:hypothetical protein